MIVGEAPGFDEVQSGRPFTGQSGSELTRMLLEVGINRNDCFITNVCHTRPPDNTIEKFFHTKTEAKTLHITPYFGRYPNQVITQGVEQLLSDIDSIRPQFIIALGATALWALTGHTAIMNWRGSALYFNSHIAGDPTHANPYSIPVLATIHPAHILRDWSNRFLAVRDLRRCAEILDKGKWTEPGWSFTIRPTFDSTIEWLNHQLQQVALAPTNYSADIETRRGQIACLGIGRNSAAICIPFCSIEHPEGYWSADEEWAITLKLREFLSHPNAHFTFHNGAYDLQYIAKQWGIAVNIKNDTMIMQHVAYPGLRKSLAMCASLYCEQYKYWKDDGKEWDPSVGEDQYWRYNCEDCVRTFEIQQVLTTVLHTLGVWEQYQFQINDLFPEVLKTMLRGIDVDMERRAELDNSLETLQQDYQLWINTAVGHPLNPRSSKKMQELFYTDLHIPVKRNRKTGAPSLDDESLTKISKSHPLLRPLVDKILEFRSIGVFLSTFVRAPIPPDKKMRCTYNITGTETFRLSSSADSFGYGTNLQNIPSGDE
jgi:uracil-DNA glycosylase family 4